MLSTTDGQWQPFCSPISGNPTYQWYRDNTSAPISGATASSYTTVAADVNHEIFALVTRCDTQTDCTAAYTKGLFAVINPLGTADYLPIWSHGPVSVNEATGNMVLSLPTPSFPTAIGSLGFSLTYNSQQLSAGNDGLGVGWLFSAGDVSPPSQVHDHLKDATPAASAEVDWPDGSPEFYQQSGSSNTYLPIQPDGSLLTKQVNGSNTTWTLIGSDENTYTFAAEDASGNAALNGVATAATASGQGQLYYTFTSGKLTQLTFKQTSSSSGESLNFNWSCAGSFLCVTGPDGLQWEYTAGDPSNPTKITGVYDHARQLFGVGYTNGRITNIRNADDFDPTHSSPGYNGNHAINLTYDASSPARVTCVIDGPISGQAASSQPSCAGGGTASESTWSFNYAPTCPTLQAPAVSHSVAQGARAGCTTLFTPKVQPSGIGITVLYDSLDRPLEYDDGRLQGSGPVRVSLVQYNSQNQIAWSEDPAGNPTDYTYDPLSGALLTVQGPKPDGINGTQPRPLTTYRYDEQTIGTATQAGNPLSGLAGSYWTNTTTLTGQPVARETDPAPGSGQTGFSFSVGGGWPPSAVSTNTTGFSTRWTGTFKVPSTGDYTFTTNSHDATNNKNDGTHLVIDGLDAIENMSSPVSPKSSQQVYLTAGATHQITLEYAHLTAGTSGANVGLQWQCPDCNPVITAQNVPVSNLAPAWTNQTSVVSPAGRISFQHYLSQASGQPDYSLIQVGSTNLITSYVYDSLGRMTKQYMPKANASATINSITGNLTSTPNTAYETDYTYYGDGTTASPPTACGGGTAVNQFGQLQQTTIPNGGLHSIVTVYNLTGLPVAITNGKGSSCLSYDTGGEGRLLSQTPFGSSTGTTTYTYDPNGSVRTTTNPNGTVTDSYDEASRLIDTVDALGAEASFSYDPDGNTLSRTAANGSLSGNTNYTTHYGYDAADELTSETDPASHGYSFFYDLRGELRGTQYPNSTFSWVDTNSDGEISDQYNRHGTITSATTTPPADSNPLADFTYTYDQDGKRLSEVRKSGATSQTSTYTYDNAGRLSQALLPSGICRKYLFDLDSNRSQIQESATGCGGTFSATATYTYDPATTPGTDELTKIVQGGSTTNYGYSSDGQATSQGTTSYTWDGFGRIGTATVASNTVTYNYDGTDSVTSRVSSAPASTIDYKLDDLFETDGSGTITTSYADGPAGDLASYAGPPATSSTVTYLYYDAHGNLAADANSSGTQTGNHTYDPFGAPTDSVPANSTVHRFVGRWNKQFDTTDALVLMGARPYDPNTGRFLSIDPIPGGSLNNYDYAGQDPIDNYDLSGTEEFNPYENEGGFGGGPVDEGSGDNAPRPEGGSRWERAKELARRIGSAAGRNVRAGLRAMAGRISQLQVNVRRLSAGLARLVRIHSPGVMRVVDAFYRGYRSGEGKGAYISGGVAAVQELIRVLRGR